MTPPPDGPPQSLERLLRAAGFTAADTENRYVQMTLTTQPVGTATMRLEQSADDPDNWRPVMDYSIPVDEISYEVVEDNIESALESTPLRRQISEMIAERITREVEEDAMRVLGIDMARPGSETTAVATVRTGEVIDVISQQAGGRSPIADTMEFIRRYSMGPMSMSAMVREAHSAEEARARFRAAHPQIADFAAVMREAGVQAATTAVTTADAIDNLRRSMSRLPPSHPNCRSQVVTANNFMIQSQAADRMMLEMDFSQAEARIMGAMPDTIMGMEVMTSPHIPEGQAFLVSREALSINRWRNRPDVVRVDLEMNPADVLLRITDRVLTPEELTPEERALRDYLEGDTTLEERLRPTRVDEFSWITQALRQPSMAWAHFVVSSLGQPLILTHDQSEAHGYIIRHGLQAEVRSFWVRRDLMEMIRDRSLWDQLAACELDHYPAPHVRAPFGSLKTHTEAAQKAARETQGFAARVRLAIARAHIALRKIEERKGYKASKAVQLWTPTWLLDVPNAIPPLPPNKLYVYPGRLHFGPDVLAVISETDEKLYLTVNLCERIGELTAHDFVGQGDRRNRVRRMGTL